MFLADHKSILGAASVNKVINAIKEADGLALLDVSTSLGSHITPEVTKSIEVTSTFLS